ncbi:MAG: Nif3-like dinuclear metal center hexameric protein [Pirellulales bacterium]
MMVTVGEIADFLESFAPLELAAEWDNVGLLVGDRAVVVDRLMTCLTITPDSAAEACAAGVQLIVSHHPLPFRPLRSLTTEVTAGRLLWQLASAGVAIYSPHTAFDSASDGINALLASRLKLRNPSPLVPHPIGPGTGRFGELPRSCTLSEFAGQLKVCLSTEHLEYVGDPEMAIANVGIACGSAAELIPAAEAAGCDVLLTGEARFHDCLEAEARSIALVLVGHYASERPGVEHLADVLARKYPSIETWASRRERDPIRWM